MASYGERGEWAFIPVSVGVFLGAGFVYTADLVISGLGVSSPLELVDTKKHDTESAPALVERQGEVECEVRQRIRPSEESFNVTPEQSPSHSQVRVTESDCRIQLCICHLLICQSASWRRILLLIVAVTIHNIPEGLAVGVGFGAVGKSKSATFSSARNLALGIGIQNFPEGVAVALPLKASGFSTLRAVWYGQLSGLVEPVAGVLGAALVSLIVPILPYALAFAAGAMIYVVRYSDRTVALI